MGFLVRDWQEMRLFLLGVTANELIWYSKTNSDS